MASATANSTNRSPRTGRRPRGENAMPLSPPRNWNPKHRSTMQTRYEPYVADQVQASCFYTRGSCEWRFATNPNSSQTLSASNGMIKMEKGALDSCSVLMVSWPKVFVPQGLMYVQHAFPLFTTGAIGVVNVERPSRPPTLNCRMWGVRSTNQVNHPCNFAAMTQHDPALVWFHVFNSLVRSSHIARTHHDVAIWCPFMDSQYPRRAVSVGPKRVDPHCGSKSGYIEAV